MTITTMMGLATAKAPKKNRPTTTTANIAGLVVRMMMTTSLTTKTTTHVTRTTTTTTMSINLALQTPMKMKISNRKPAPAKG